MVRSLHEVRFPNEGTEYRDARNELLLAERELRVQIERVAAQRRSLPLGGELKEDYVFEEVVGDTIRHVTMSDLFGSHNTLIAYNFMFSPREGARPCPSCTSMLDGMDGQVRHLTQRAAFAVIARAPIDRVMDFARERDWRSLRLLSSTNNAFNADYHGERSDGSQMPLLNVFRRRGAKIVHTWASELLFVPSEPGEDGRHIDLIWPPWNMLDTTPEGRGTDWHPKLDY
jgi:predicted dithiol-disulfide oxidoreductase (DUF899 family)